MNWKNCYSERLTSYRDRVLNHNITRRSSKKYCMSKRSPQLLLEDIVASANKIMSYTINLTFDQFLEDEKTVDAVIRNFEIIGEAANRLPDEVKDKYPNIDWHRIRGFRNRIVHDYMGIDYKIVWLIIESFLPKLIDNITAILPISD